MRLSLLKKLVIHLVLIILGITMVVPFLWMVSTSLKGFHEIFRYPPTWIPEKPQWSNYLQVWKLAPFGRFYVNSVFVAVATTAGLWSSWLTGAWTRSASSPTRCH